MVTNDQIALQGSPDRRREASRTRVLAFVDYYLPGYKGGGPSRTVANLVEALGDEIDFSIVTRDRDLGDHSAYPSVVRNEWSEVGKAKVYYASPSTLSPVGIAKLLRRTPYDIVYLNSLFSWRMTIQTLMVIRLGLAPKQPCILAPRGELGLGALGLKSRKKRSYLAFARKMGLFTGVTWQASSPLEASDIRRMLGDREGSIEIAPNLARTFQGASVTGDRKGGESLKVVFLGRVVPMKNLLFALEVLSHVRFPLELSVYGPIEDLAYWGLCQEKIDYLPENVRFHYSGAVEPHRVQAILAQHDLLFLPTQGENYGHAIAEALQAGTPVLISDRTPWKDVGAAGVGAEIPLEDVQAFVGELKRQYDLSSKERAEQADRIQRYCLARQVAAAEAIELNRKLFEGNRSASRAPA
jgi:glycosyltransferase involved in cell wall biosynthesis